MFKDITSPTYTKRDFNSRTARVLYRKGPGMGTGTSHKCGVSFGVEDNVLEFNRVKVQVISRRVPVQNGTNQEKFCLV